MSRETVRALAIGLVIGASAAGLISTVRAQAPATEVRATGDVIRFFVEGREVARIDAEGLRVAGSITHSGALISTNGTSAMQDLDAKERDR